MLSRFALHYMTKVLDAEVPYHLLVTHSSEAGASHSEIADIRGAKALEYLQKQLRGKIQQSDLVSITILLMANLQ